LVPRLVAPLAERCGLPVWTTQRRVGELQWRSPEELEERALSMLRPLLAHAAHHVPHYRELLAGIEARDIKATADLARVPITNKGELRAGFPRRATAENLPESRRQPMMTSGSTGLPFEFFWDRAAVPAMGGTGWFWLGWGGGAPWHTRLVLGRPAYFYE